MSLQECHLLSYRVYVYSFSHHVSFLWWFAIWDWEICPWPLSWLYEISAWCLRRKENGLSLCSFCELSILLLLLVNPNLNPYVRVLRALVLAGMYNFIIVWRNCEDVFTIRARSFAWNWILSSSKKSISIKWLKVKKQRWRSTKGHQINLTFGGK